MSQQDNSNSKKKNPLNNSSIDLRTDKVLPLPTVKVLHVHNMLNADKENIQYAPMEKNLARSLRPALRTVNQTGGSTANQLMETPKVFKQIRFNLGSGSGQQNDTLTPTPPPKEFKRFGNRKTLRNERCLSAIVTENEKELLEASLNTSKPAPGFVKSMCKLYADWSPRRSSSTLNRSHSFSGGDTAHEKDAEKEGSFFENNSTKEQSEVVGEETTEKISPPQRKAGSFRLFRSNSWTTAKRNKKTEVKITSPTTTTITNTIENQRCSPSYSTKSQDSGFSENAAAPTANNNNNTAGTTSGTSGSNTAQSIQNQRLQFLRSNMELPEQDSDPNLTQMTSVAPDQHLELPKSNIVPTSILKNPSKQKVSESLNNIASLQTGLQLKRSMAEDCHPPIGEGPLPVPQNGALNLLRPHQQKLTNKIRPKSFQESVNDLSQDFSDGSPVFSTPVRASFRQKARQLRPHTSIHLDEAKTPSKRDGKLTRLRELKTKGAGRRWSAAESGCVDGGNYYYNNNNDKAAADDIPPGIEPSLVAVWNQFLGYEPSGIPSSLSSMVTPSLNLEPTTAGTSNTTHYLNGLTFSSAAIDQSAVAAARGARAGQLTSEVVSVDDHLSLGQLSATQLSEISQFGPNNSGSGLIGPSSSSENHHRNSLMLQCNTSNSLGGHEEAIIELEEQNHDHDRTPKALPPKIQQKSSQSINTSPVCEWWKDLHAWCEPECMTYLQSKPILTTPMSTTTTATSSPSSMSSPSVRSSSSSSPNNAGSATQTPTTAEEFFNKDVQVVNIIKQLQRGAKSITVTFTSIDKHLSAKNFQHMGKTLQVLLNQVQQYVYDYNMGRFTNSDQLSDSFNNYEWNFPGLRKNVAGATNLEDQIIDQDGMKELVLLQQRVVLQSVDRLKLCTHRSQYNPNQPMAEMAKILEQLRKSFHSMLDKMYSKELRPLVKEIDGPNSPVGIRSAMHSVIALGNEAGMGSSGSSKAGNAICGLLAKEGCVRALLRQCLPNVQRNQDIRILALRGLSAICCVADCIRELEKADGLQVINQLLCSRGSLIEDRIEAAGVLAQITSPWISDNHKIQNLDHFVYNMVNALTGLSRMNGGEETFLLVTAALANLTFMSPLSSAAMKRCGTPEALVKAVRRSPFTTMFAKDQVVTVLANMAANTNCRHDIEAMDGVGFLLAMLETKLTNILAPAELSAAERVQKKAAIALSRLCNSTKVCRDLVRLNGIDRLVELCRSPSERNHSDAVLVSCLAVLRRLHANSEDSKDLTKILQQLKAIDLIQPNLVDSFMEYSTCQTKQESYV